MSITAIGAPRASSGTSGAHEVEAQRTPATPAELRAALGRAYQRLTGRPATAGLLDTLSAQVSLETGRGSSMYNFNFGGIKGASPRGESATYGTREVLPEGEVHVKARFRAYDSLDEGAEDYLRVMHGRFGGAMPYAASGDVDGFAHALKGAGYYTASEHDYAKALHGLTGTSASTVTTSALLPVPTSFSAPAAGLTPGGLDFGAAAAGGAGPTEGELSRVLDALSLSAARIAAPSEDADR